jgi:N-methylhydantoinase B
MTAGVDRIDPIRLEVIRNGLSASAEEMALALQRAAYSTNIKTRLDFSCAIFDRSVRVIAQSFSQPNHLGSLAHFVPCIIAEYGDHRLQPGDVILSNDGHRGGVHLNDVCLVSPVFHDDDIVAFVATLAHHVDVGGGTPGSLAGLSREVYGEGLRIPPIRFLNAGEIDENLFKLIMNNIRSPRESSGDLRAQVAGANIGIRRIHEMIGKYGWDVIARAIEDVLDYTERRAREELMRLPQGTYEATDFMDDDGVTDKAIKVAVRITIGEGTITFDLSGSDPQRPCPLNSTFAMTLSSCAYAVRALMSSDIPVNAGFYRVLQVIAPEGSIVNALPPAAIGGGWETAFRVLETAFQALAQAVPERLAAGSKGCLCNIALGGEARDGNGYFVFYEAMGGGYGARATKDGIDAIQPHVQNTENAPIEETEASYPIRFARYELIPDSEGAGRHRGGLGLRRDYEVDRPTTFSVLADRAKFAPWGLDGGLQARPAHYIFDPYGGPREMPSKFSLDLLPGQVFSIQMGGGGGYGPPHERDPEAVLADVLAERVSSQRAREAYGVVIDPQTATVDEPSTTQLRAEMRTQEHG